MPRWLLAVLAIAGLAGLFSLWLFLPINEWIERFNSWVEGLGLAGGLIYAGAYAVATVLVFPGSVLTLGAGLVFGLQGFFVVLAGASLGAVAAYSIARFVARDAVERRLAGNRRFRAVDRAVAEDGWKIVGLLRLSPLIPFNLQNYLYGITSVGFWPHAVATVFGIMPGTLLYVYLGAAGKAALAGTAESEGDVLKWSLFALGFVATVIATVLITRKARAKLDEMGVEEELEPQA